jgi:hypothetical protein
MENRGHISANRWHIADSVPFQTSFDAAIGKYFSNERPTRYASTVYWYLERGGFDPYGPVPVNARTSYWKELGGTNHVAASAFEAETLRLLRNSGGHLERQVFGGFDGGWSGGRQLRWSEASPGDRLELAVPVSKTGLYRLAGRFAEGPGQAIVQVDVNGRAIGGPVDLYAPELGPRAEQELGMVELAAGEAVFGVEVLGANPDAVRMYTVGIDYVRLELVE